MDDVQETIRLLDAAIQEQGEAARANAEASAEDFDPGAPAAKARLAARVTKRPVPPEVRRGPSLLISCTGRPVDSGNEALVRVTPRRPLAPLCRYFRPALFLARAANSVAPAAREGRGCIP